MGAPGVMAGSMLVSAGVGMAGQNASARAQASYYNYLSSTATTNASLTQAAAHANLQAIGAQESDEMRRTSERIRQTVGAQKTAMVSGVGVGSRSGQDIVKNTLTQGNLDERAILMNAEMKAKAMFAGADMATFNSNAQAAGYGVAAGNVMNALPFQMASTLLGGATQASSSFYMMNMYGGGGRMSGGQSPAPGNIGSVT